MIEFNIDAESGKTVKANNKLGENEGGIRNLNIDGPFVLFLREEGREMPYFAAKITAITKFVKSHR